MGVLDYDMVDLGFVRSDIARLRRLHRDRGFRVYKIERTARGYHVYFFADSELSALMILHDSRCDYKYKLLVFNTGYWRIGIDREEQRKVNIQRKISVYGYERARGRRSDTARAEEG